MSTSQTSQSSAASTAQLLLTAGSDEFVALRAALLRLHREHHERFVTLLAPDSRARRIESLPPEVSWPLLRFGLIERDGDGAGLVGRHRVRTIGDRLYVMELGGLVEYFQDVWPETDSLLQALESAAPGRLLDLGTGTGIIAIEAARRGHQVVATDLYPTALALAQFNARLNGVERSIEFRVGHQFEPVRGELFDLILTAPHYTRVADQLRLEVLRAGPSQLAPGGRLVVATMLEWQSGPPPIIEEILRPQAESGFAVHVEPLKAPYKREWFTVRRLSPELLSSSGAPLVSRHRFVVTVTAPSVRSASSGMLSVRPPSVHEQMIQPYGSLARLRQSARLRPEGPSVMPMAAVVSSDRDVVELRSMLAALDGGVLSLGSGTAFVLHDACRFGARRCVTAQGFDGAAGAILDVGGQVRPCSHGQPVGRLEDTTEQLIGKLAQSAEAARTRRGCASCAVEPHCSQCLFPFPLDELHYCELMRSFPQVLPLLPRLTQTLPRLAAWSQTIPLSVELRLKVTRSAELIAAEGRPPVQAPRALSGHDLKLAHNLTQLAKAWLHYRTWLAALGRNHFALLLSAGSSLPLVPIPPLSAAIAELVADGSGVDEIRQYLRLYTIAPDVADQALTPLYRRFQIQPT
jgi:SAM-dependent methyltransferase